MILLEKTDILQFDISHNGKFPFKATLSCKLIKDFKDKEVHLYYNNNGKPEYIEIPIVSELGFVTFGFNHASSYVITTEILKGSVIKKALPRMTTL